MSEKVQRVGIVTRPGIDERYLERLTAALEKAGVEIEPAVEAPNGDEAGRTVDLVFVLGGDGTMLLASRLYPGCVMLGVNLGTVGFMSGMLPDEIEAGVESVLDGGLHVQEYRMLEVRVSGEEEVYLALNDVVLLKPTPHQITSVGVSVGGEDLVTVQCDGFIAATPLGSTAYALSAGGPIVSGDTECYVLVSIAPHSLVSRPMVLGEKQVTRLELIERSALLSIDGMEPREIPAGGHIRLGLSRESVRIGRTKEWSWWRAVRRTFL
jgi:NAD+ kinase